MLGDGAPATTEHPDSETPTDANTAAEAPDFRNRLPAQQLPIGNRIMYAPSLPFDVRALRFGTLAGCDASPFGEWDFAL